MTFAIIRGGNGHRHEVDFADAHIEVDVAASETTVQITVEAPHDHAPSDKRRLATLALPRERLLAALDTALRRPPERARRPRLRLVEESADDDR